MVSKVVKKLAVLSTLMLAQTAFATPLSSNSSYSLSGSGVGDGEVFADNGGIFLAFYQTDHGSQLHAGDFYAYFNLNGSMNTGNISGNNLSLIDIISSGTLQSVVQYNGTSWQSVAGATGNTGFAVDYENVTINNNHDTLALVNGTGTASGGTLDVNISHSGNTINLSNLSSVVSFMPFDSTSQNYYDPAINAFSNNGILDFAMAGFNGGIHGWFQTLGTVSFGGQTFYLQGDIHANYSAVPEPASMGLLTAGLLGVITRRKKKVLA